MTYDNAVFSANFKNQVDLYNQWKEMTGKNMSFLGYEALVRGNGVQNLFQDYENILEGDAQKGDGKAGNLLSFDRYFSEDNKIIVQTQDGKYISMDANSGEVNTDSAAVLKDLETRFGLGGVTANGKAYNVADMSKNGVEFTKYDFLGSVDQKSDPNHLTINSLNLATDGDEIKSIVAEYLRDHGGKGKLSDIFGRQNVASGSNAYNRVNDNFSIVKQGSNLYAMTLSDTGEFKMEQITPANASKYYEGIPNPAPASLIVGVDANNGITVAYPNQPAGGSTTPRGGITGDPHFYASNGAYMFDFQGAGGGTTGDYTLLQNANAKWTSHFDKYQGGQDGSTIMSSQHLELESGKLVIDYQKDGTVTVKHNGEVITDEKVLKSLGIVKTGNALTVTSGTDYYKFNGHDGYIDVETNAIKAGSTGLLTQADDLMDGKASATDLNQRMVNSNASAISAPVIITDGQSATDLAASFIDTTSKVGGSAYASTVMTGASTNLSNTTDVNYNYNPANDNTRTVAQKAELCSRIAYAAMQDKTIAPDLKKAIVANWIEMSSAAMMADIDAAKGSSTSFASRFQEGHGYSRSQWNEYVGTVSFASNADVNKDGTVDAALDDDGDGAINGFDLNHDGILQANERVIKELDELSQTTVGARYIGQG